MNETLKSQLAKVPSVDRLLKAEGAQPLLDTYGRAEVTRAIRDALADLRQVLKSGKTADSDVAVLLATVSETLARETAPPFRPVFNLTGTVLHTNLGRAALPASAIDAVVKVARGASNLEYDLVSGRRGDRDTHIEAQICQTTGAEAATVVNNNAAAVMLVINSLALGKEVPVSRGELVEIGGSFRIPDIMARSGGTLVEVGTTNRTHPRDFENAIGPDTGMVMKVHTSNYVIEGFTATVPEPEISEICRKHNVPFVNDLGSGTLVDLERFGLPHEPTPMDALQNGADVVTFSGDKLLGGPQAGVIVGRADLIARIKANPMKRALRCDKMTIAALSEVLRLYADPDRVAERLPALRALTRSREDIQTAADRVQDDLAGRLGDDLEVSVVECESEIGSGALPTRTIASVGIAVRPPAGAPGSGSALNRIAAAFRALPVPVIGRIHNDALVFDLRCLFDEDGFVAQLSKLELSK